MSSKTRLLGGFLTAGMLIALAIALFGSPFASSSPDGMSRVAIDTGFAGTEKASPVEDKSPVGGYGVKGIANERVGTGISGVIGVVLTFAIGYGLFRGLRVLRRRQSAGGAART